MGYSPNNLVVVCVDIKEQQDYCGRWYSPYITRGVHFFGVVQMLSSLEMLFNNFTYPQACFRQRSFTGQGKEIYFNAREAGHAMSDEAVINNRGEKATFIVQIQYRQNASWQGKITWADRQCSQYFRSALEMLQLMNGAMEQSGSGQLPSWSSDEKELGQPANAQAPATPGLGESGAG